MAKKYKVIPEKKSARNTSSSSLCAGMIHDLISVRNYSISRIAKRCGVASSTIRKALADNNRQVTPRLFTKVLTLYCRNFYQNNTKQYKIQGSALNFEVKDEPP